MTIAEDANPSRYVSANNGFFFPTDDISDFVHRQTAVFCQDLEGPKEIHRPKSRVITRLMFTVLVCLAAVVLVLVLMYTQESSYKTVRYWSSSYPLKLFGPFIYTDNVTQDQVYNTDAASTLCPCSKNAFSWSLFVDFFTISYGPQGTIRTSNITDGSTFCFKKISHLPLNESLITSIGCPNIVNSIVNKSDSRTIITTISLMDPALLNTTITRYMRSNLVTALNNCVYLMSNLTTWNVSQPFGWLKDIYDVFDDMLVLYDSNWHVSDLEFWNMTNKKQTSLKVPLIQVLDNNEAIGIEVNWTKYTNLCNPRFCDVVKDVTFISKCVSTLAEIGGLSAVIFFLIRQIVWPCICFWCGWRK